MLSSRLLHRRLRPCPWPTALAAAPWSASAAPVSQQRASAACTRCFSTRDFSTRCFWTRCMQPALLQRVQMRACMVLMVRSVTSIAPSSLIRPCTVPGTGRLPAWPAFGRPAACSCLDACCARSSICCRSSASCLCTQVAPGSALDTLNWGHSKSTLGMPGALRPPVAGLQGALQPLAHQQLPSGVAIRLSWLPELPALLQDSAQPGPAFLPGAVSV